MKNGRAVAILALLVASLTIWLILAGPHGGPQPAASIPATDGRQLGPPQLELPGAPPVGEDPRVGIEMRVESEPVPSAVKTSIHVVDEGGTSIEGATVWQVSTDQEHLMGTTDSGGELLWASELDACMLVGMAAGMGRVEKRIPKTGLGTRLELVLAEQATLRGVVWERDEGGAAMRGVRVWAMPADPVNDFTFLDPYRAARMASGASTSIFATTDENGVFEITGLDPRRRYDISAIHYGWRNIDARVGWTPDGEQVDLTMAQCWGCIVRLPVEANSNLRLSRVGWAKRHPVAGYFDRADGFERMVDAELLLAWGETAQLDPRTWLTTVSYSANGEQDLGSLILDINLPGYRARSVSIPLEFIGASIPIVEVELEATTEGTGHLDFSFEGVPPGMEAGDRDMLVGVLHLHPLQEGEDLFFNLDVEAVLHGGRLDGVPLGAYRCHLVMHPGHASAPRTDPATPTEAEGGLLVEVGPEGGRAEFDLAHLGLLSVAMLDPDGAPYAGMLNYELYRKQGGGAEQEWSMGSGTVISAWRTEGEVAVSLLDPGHYRFFPVPRVVGLVPSVGADENGSAVQPYEIEIQAGKRVQILLQGLATH